MRPLCLDSLSDQTVLPPLVQMSFVFADQGKGKVYYTSNLDPTHSWVADMRCTIDGEKVIITQANPALCEGEPSEFKPAVFTVISDSRGKSKIEKIESASIPQYYTPYIKKTT